MRETRLWTLVAVAAACALVVWLIVRLTFTTLPPLPWTAVPALLILAIAESFSGRNLRARIQGRRGGKPLAPIAVARMAALAKASSLGGAVFGGFGAGFLVYTLGSIDKAVPRRDAISAGVTLASAIVLVAAALYLERCCRAPAPPDDENQDDQHRQPGIR
jgi:4-amino-4-deoxy-L-arabinose transferase-like glycosyltransferase